MLLDGLTEIASGRVELLRDERGIYGFEFRGPVVRHWREGTKVQEIDISVRLRPDKVACYSRDENIARQETSFLQTLPHMKFLRGRSAEAQIADRLFTTLLARSGLSRETGWDRTWWSNDKDQQAKNRRTFHGRKRQALRIVNALIREALAVADQDAMRLARRFPIIARYSVYHFLAGFQRMHQLAETFPALVFGIATRQDRESVLRAVEAVERGAPLKTVADILEVPMAYRRIKPGACGIVRPVGELSDLINSYLPGL